MQALKHDQISAPVHTTDASEAKPVTKHNREGYVYKHRSAGRSTVKMPLFCPYEKCRRPTNTIDDGYILEYGVCGNCFVEYVEGRKTPLIDVQEYAQRFKERGF